MQAKTVSNVLQDRRPSHPMRHFQAIPLVNERKDRKNLRLHHPISSQVVLSQMVE